MCYIVNLLSPHCGKHHTSLPELLQYLFEGSKAPDIKRRQDMWTMMWKDKQDDLWWRAHSISCGVRWLLCPLYKSKTNLLVCCGDEWWNDSGGSYGTKCCWTTPSHSCGFEFQEGTHWTTLQWISFLWRWWREASLVLWHSHSWWGLLFLILVRW